MYSPLFRFNISHLLSRSSIISGCEGCVFSSCHIDVFFGESTFREAIFRESIFIHSFLLHFWGESICIPSFLLLLFWGVDFNTFSFIAFFWGVDFQGAEFQRVDFHTFILLHFSTSMLLGVCMLWMFSFIAGSRGTLIFLGCLSRGILALLEGLLL